MPFLSNLSFCFQYCILARVSHKFQLGGTFPEETEWNVGITVEG